VTCVDKKNGSHDNVALMFYAVFKQLMVVSLPLYSADDIKVQREHQQMQMNEKIDKLLLVRRQVWDW
jgi:hypothetical protein